MMKTAILMDIHRDDAFYSRKDEVVGSMVRYEESYLADSCWEGWKCVTLRMQWNDDRNWPEEGYYFLGVKIKDI